MLFYTLLETISMQKKIRLSLSAGVLVFCCSSSFSEEINQMSDKELFKEGFNSVLPALEERLGGQRATSDAMRRYGISDEKMANTREMMLKEFGLYTNVQGFVLVSSSMTDSLIRAYSLEAEKFGFSIIFRGVEDEGDVFNSFTQMANKYHTGDSRMTVQLDPRLFDVFDVQAVPAIVLTEELSLNLCNEFIVSDHVYDGVTYQKSECAPLEKEKYCKIYGAVFIGWAIKKMQENGCLMSLSFGDVDEYESESIDMIGEDIWGSLIRESKEEDSIYMDVFKKNIKDPGFK
jgi:type-F conjugative transfer system pilin assembly protein TrbC